MSIFAQLFFIKKEPMWFALVALSKRVTMSKSLPSLFAQLLFIKELPKWFALVAQKRDHEQIAPVALYERATVSDSLRSPMPKERREWYLSFSQANLFHLQKIKKMSDLLEKPMSKIPTLTVHAVECRCCPQPNIVCTAPICCLKGQCHKKSFQTETVGV